MTEYFPLNTAQRAAAESIEGPVYVYAGPGTGKTQMLVHRIQYILQQTEALPSNILCLTFSNAGVHSMKAKIEQLIGDKAQQVSIHTFHSFASKILQLSGRFNGQNPVISQVNAFMLLENLLAHYADLHHSPPEKPVSSLKLKSILDIFANMKKESIDEGMLNNFIDEAITSIELDPSNTFANGNLRASAKEEIEKLDSFRKWGTIYSMYNDALEHKGLYDYEDLINLALAELVFNKSLVASLQQQYTYILVDEFQDTNAKQLSLLEYLLNGVQSPNLFIVGDDDQCIYRFQGALETGIHQLEQLFGTFSKYVLLDNYRSFRPLLNAAHHLIKNTPNRPSEKIELAWKKGRGQEVSLPLIEYMHTLDQEFQQVAEKIALHIRDGEPAHEIAVLFRKRSIANEFIAWLGYYKIPFVWNTSEQDVLHTAWGKSYAILLQYLILVKDQDAAAFNLVPELLSARFGESIIQDLYTDFRIKKQPGQEFSTWLGEYEEYQIYVQWLDSIQSIDIQSVLNSSTFIQLEDMMGLTCFRQEPTSSSLIAAWDNHVNAFIQTAKNPNLISFNRNIRYHLTHGIDIPFEEPLPKGFIVLSTIHGSKGLEFDHIFMPACSKKYWEEAKNRSSVISIPRSIHKRFNIPSDTKSDMRRLAYVGVTRARKNLVMTFSGDTSNDESFFIKEICKSKFYAYVFNPNMDTDTCKNQYRKIKVNPTKELRIKKALNNFELTASAVNGYLQNPHTFYTQQVLKIPFESNRAMVFGTAVHKALENLILAFPTEMPAKEDVQRLWYSSIDQYKNHFDTIHLKHYKAYGLPMLLQYLPILFPLTNGAQYEIEKELHASLGEVLLKGRLDLMIIQESKIRVIDFKTGTGSDGFKPFVSIIDPGSPYWRQASIYKLLVEQNYPGYDVEVAFHYVENGKTMKYKAMSDTSSWHDFLAMVWNQIHLLHIPAYVNPSFWN